jgi:biotin carboxyl carrier protein
MTAQALNSLRRTWQEIAVMLLVAALALTCVAAVNQKIANGLDSSATQMIQTAFGEDPLPDPEVPAPSAVAVIACPVDGVFQAGTISGGPAFVSVGTTVTAETKLGVIRPEDATAMPILAGLAGTIKEILVKDQDVVLAGQPLFKIERAKMPETPEE